MAQKLPSGLIQSGTPYVAGNEDDDRIPMDDIVRLWRAHFVLKSAQASDTSFRLEYFFWRIMGSSQLQQILTESQIARFHAVISQNDPIRTTPRQSPIKFSINSDVSDSSSMNANFFSDDRLPSNAGRRNLDTSTTKIPTSRDRSTSRPPRPILRTPGIDTIATGKSARILTPTWGGDNAKGKGKLPMNEEMFDVQDSSLQRQSPTSFALDNTTSIASTSALGTALSAASPKSVPLGSPSKSTRKSSFAVGSKRRRPAMPYRRSSQSATNLTSKSPRQSPIVNQGSFDSARPTSDRQNSLQQICETSNRNETAGQSSSTPSLRTGINQNRSEGDLKLAATNLSLIFNPHLRAISTKAALSTGVSLVSPITASLQPFADQGSSTGSLNRIPSESSNLNTRSSQSGIDTLQRSRDNLNLLLERDRQRTSAPK